MRAQPSPRAAYSRVLGGQASMIGARSTTNAAASAPASTALPTQAASSSGFAQGGVSRGGASKGRAARSGSGRGDGSRHCGAACSGRGGAAGTGGHCVPHRAHRTMRPGATAGTSYSDAQDGHMILTPRKCGTRPTLAMTALPTGARA